MRETRAYEKQLTTCLIGLSHTRLLLARLGELHIQLCTCSTECFEIVKLLDLEIRAVMHFEHLLEYSRLQTPDSSLARMSRIPEPGKFGSAVLLLMISIGPLGQANFSLGQKMLSGRMVE